MHDDVKHGTKACDIADAIYYDRSFQLLVRRRLATITESFGDAFGVFCISCNSPTSPPPTCQIWYLTWAPVFQTLKMLLAYLKFELNHNRRRTQTNHTSLKATQASTCPLQQWTSHYRQRCWYHYSFRVLTDSPATSVTERHNWLTSQELRAVANKNSAIAACAVAVGAANLWRGL